VVTSVNLPSLHLCTDRSGADVRPPPGLRRGCQESQRTRSIPDYSHMRIIRTLGMPCEGDARTGEVGPSGRLRARERDSCCPCGRTSRLPGKARPMMQKQDEFPFTVATGSNWCGTGLSPRFPVDGHWFEPSTAHLHPDGCKCLRQPCGSRVSLGAMARGWCPPRCTPDCSTLMDMAGAGPVIACVTRTRVRGGICAASAPPGAC
jgi:hypothetical protein